MHETDGPGKHSPITLYRQYLDDLATEPEMPVGTRMYIEEDGLSYFGIGQTTSEIVMALGWSQQNVWMPDHALADIRRKHPVIVNPIATAALVLQQPISVHQGRRSTDRYFCASADIIREPGLLRSRSTRYVDAAVELRLTMHGRIILRLFHLSPATRNKGGIQVWP